MVEVLPGRHHYGIPSFRRGLGDWLEAAPRFCNLQLIIDKLRRSVNKTVLLRVLIQIFAKHDKGVAITKSGIEVVGDIMGRKRRVMNDEKQYSGQVVADDAKADFCFFVFN